MHILCVCARRSQASLREFILSLNCVGDSGIKLSLSDLLSSAFYPLSHFCVPLLNFLAKALHFFHSKPCELVRVASYGWKRICCAVGVLYCFICCFHPWGIESGSRDAATNSSKSGQKALDSTMNRTGPLPGNWVYMLTVGKSVAYRRCLVHHKEDRVDVFRSFHTNLDRNLF